MAGPVRAAGLLPGRPRALTNPIPAQRRSLSWACSLAALVLLLLCSLTPTHAQGCSQCRESVGQTPARTQTAYRRAILLMLAAGATVFTGGLVALRRFR